MEEREGREVAVDLIIVDLALAEIISDLRAAAIAKGHGDHVQLPIVLRVAGLRHADIVAAIRRLRRLAAAEGSNEEADLTAVVAAVLAADPARSATIVRQWLFTGTVPEEEKR